MGSEDEVPAAASRVMMRLEGREACRRGARAAVRGLEGRRACLDGAAMDARVGANDVDMLEASRGGGASATSPYLTRSSLSFQRRFRAMKQSDAILVSSALKTFSSFTVSRFQPSIKQTATERRISVVDEL
jgi:hypothetical protein